MTESDTSSRAKSLLIILAALSVGARLLQLAGFHPLVWDEIEFFRATDWVRQGLVPYRDFWEHHTPLQWFLFAPMTALTHSTGASAIILMRWAQLPLWLFTFVLLRGILRRTGASAFAAWSALALTLTSTLFMLPAVEYRVDVLGCAVYIAALALLLRIDEGRHYAVLAGAALCLTGFANLRLGPLAVLTLLLVRVVRPREREWRGNPRANWCFAGAAAMFAIAASYFIATHSAAIAWQRLWSDNFVADRYAQPPVDWMFLHRLTVPFGLRLIDAAINFQPSTIDPAGVAILVAGAIAIVRALRRWREPDYVFLFAVLQLVNFLFIAAMKYVFNYHLLIAVLLMAPLVAAEIDRFPAKRAVVALVLIAATINIAAAVFRGKESDTVYQDFVMREVERRIPPGAKVWDSAGFALHHPPAYRYWFLRANVFVMEAHGKWEPYTVDDVLRDPPAAIIADYDVRRWIGKHPQFGAFIISNYLPLWRDIWLPAPNARLVPAHPIAQWKVLADGDYDLYASTRLGWHPWYRQPLNFEIPLWKDPRISFADRGAHVEWLIDGVPTTITDRITLRRGQLLSALSFEPVPVGVMLINSKNESAFCQPPEGVTLEASAMPQWHRPDFAALAQIARGTAVVQPRLACTIRRR